MAFFNLKKQKEEPKVEIVPDEVVKTTLDIYRANGNRIYNMLDEIEFDSILKNPEIANAELDVYEGAVHKTMKGSEIINKLHSEVDYLLSKLRAESSAELLKIDSEIIDANLIYFADVLSESIKKGNLVTAMTSMLGLGYGIEQGHKPLPPYMTDPEKIKKELKKRNDKVRIYRDIAELSVANDEYRKQKASFTAEYINIKKSFQKAHDEFIEHKSKHSDIYEAINNLTGKEIKEEFSEEYLEAWRLTSKNNNLYNQGIIYNSQISTIGNFIDINDQQMLSLRNAAIARQFEIDPELDMQIREDLKTVTLAMEKMQAELIDKQQILDRLFADFKTITNSREIHEAMYKEIRESKAVDKEIERKEIAEREGEIRYKQYLKEEAEKAARAIDEAEKAEEELQKAEQNLIKPKKKQTTSFN